MKRILLIGLLWFAPFAGMPVYAHDAADRGVPSAANQPSAASPRAGAPAAAPKARDTAIASDVAAPPDHTAHAGVVADRQSSVQREEGMTMLHPGLDASWITAAAVLMLVIALWSVVVPLPVRAPARGINLARAPLIGRLIRFVNASPNALAAVKCLSVAVFLLAVVAGLFGTPYPERNLATVLVWNLWWPLVIVSVLLFGSAWCAVCPWDALSNWIVRRRFWRRVNPHPGLNRKVPRYLQNVWPALLLFLGLTWLEVGMGIVSIPFATASLALIMLVLCIGFLLVFERKAFCRYACPVGRTLGYYARLAPVAVRAVHQPTCDGCKTLECYHGSKLIEPCPSRLVVGRFSENTYCLSCGNCVYSCPEKNVSWWLRPVNAEASELSRPLRDGAWFMLALLGITTFHGLTMMPFWGEWTTGIARLIGESGKLYASFTVSMLGSFAIPVLLYAGAIALVRMWAPRDVSYMSLFAAFSFAALPLAFGYHLAHNLHHLSRESGDLLALMFNPFGTGLAPLSAAERHDRMMASIFPDEVMYTLQAGLLVAGFWLAVNIVRHRAREYWPHGGLLPGWRLLPMLLFIAVITAMNLWVMAQDMEMRF